MFATLINEMQTASEQENDDGQSKQSSYRVIQKCVSPPEDHRGLYAASTQMSQSSPLRIEGEYQNGPKQRSRNDYPNE